MTLVDAAAGDVPGGKPRDLALSSGDRFLYVLDPNHQAAFGVGRDGGLTTIGSVTGLPPAAVGLAAR